MNNELEARGTEAIVAYLRLLSWHLPRMTETQHDSLYPCRDLNQASPDYKSEALLRDPVCSVPLLNTKVCVVFLLGYSGAA
jgi:hypothetical protein